MTSTYRRQWDVASFTKPSQRPYKVSERQDGGWECSCPAWTRKTPRVDCKHIAMIRQAMTQAPLRVTATPDSRRTTQAGRTPVALANDLQPVVIDGYTIRPHRGIFE